MKKLDGKINRLEKKAVFSLGMQLSETKLLFKTNFKKTVLLGAGFLCLMLCFAASLKAEAKIGVVGLNAQKYLAMKKVEFGKLSNEDMGDIKKLEKYPVIIYQRGRLNAKHYATIRKYVRNGGTLYWEYPWKKDIAGAVSATRGYSPGSCFKVRADKKHPITEGLEIGKWVSIEHPMNSRMLTYASTHVFTPQTKDTEVLLSVEIAKVKVKGKDQTTGEPVYAPEDKRTTYVWLVMYKYGRGTVITGLSGMFRYEENVEGYKKSVKVIDKLLMNLVSFLNKKEKPLAKTPNLNIVSAKLFMEMIDCNKGQAKPIFLNGVKVGMVPDIYKGWSKSTAVEIPATALHAIATKNTIQIKNPDKDPFKLRNLYLEVIDKKGNVIRSNTFKDVLCSFRNGWTLCEGIRSVYNGAPLPLFELTLPTDKLGNISQSKFKYDTNLTSAEEKKPRNWPGLQKAAIGRSSKSTSCWVNPNDFLDFTKEELADKLTRYNAKEIATFGKDKLKSKDGLEKIAWLRKQGYLFKMAFSKIRPTTNLLPGTKGYKAFFENVEFWSTKVDIIGCDEWFISPALASTQGGTVSYFTPELLEAFCKFAGISMEDALWVFKGSNKYSNDPRTLKAWAFCEKIQNDISREFVRVAKKANPKVKTWVSYITHNWNKYVTSIDTSIVDFDEILDCQTYWYGRYSNKPLNAAKATSVIGLGKLYQCEYPDKFVWTGFGPGYAGGKPTAREKNKWWKHLSHYNNSPEEVVPYLATLYASSDGVFVFTTFNGNAPGDGSDNDFADVFRLVSSLVPRVKDYVKSDVAYYYDPLATWNAARQGQVWFTKREGARVSIGYLQQFCDVDVTKNIKGYRNVITSGVLLPKVLDYKKQKLYFMYRPEYSEKGQKATAQQMKKLGITGFKGTSTNYYQLTGDIQMDNVLGAYVGDIRGADKVLRTLKFKTKKYVVGAQNKKGNIRLNSFFPPYTRQRVMRKVLKKDLDYFGWTKRDCPQINGKKNIVAVAFREPRTAVLDFGKNASCGKVKIVIFNGKDGVTRNETVKYQRGMKIALPPLNVLVATGIK